MTDLSKLTDNQVKELLYECIEVLGVADIDSARMALGVSRCRIYQLMKPENTITIGKHKFLCINLKT